jgi:hypothetical protein
MDYGRDGAVHVAMGRKKMHTGIWWVNVKGTDYSEDLDTDGSLNIKTDL